MRWRLERGDWNAKVGKHVQWNGCIGRFGIGILNDREQSLLKFAEKYKLFIANTLHQYKTQESQHGIHPID